ncbi:Rpn family recombination-promoting nuclease/putative transposase [Anabaena cylindrica UHCC 0172]|uniref:Rpn family recombination-promoting nuclease/putative transposase n=1 Tax=Anabaena cylindrica TaxID=1165 RepID=UPI002B2164DA|nr:Rpn family recombination-promoting nuclease/putative transposase [Anabaena cylindrica]MEA5554430.1 Rpn family recombination-promoting nuclease/putative transposase [Anabaena cylindrica UHCC 0172]
MRRDSIFYKLFQQYPSVLFQLLAQPLKNADNYRFDSVAVKEPKFEIDGVFLLPENDSPGIVYFCEVQFQKDEQLYERVFAESHLYFYRNRTRFSDWQAVVIYPSRNIEQSDIYPHRALLNSDQVHRIYLDELGDIHQLPVWVALMVLTTLEESQAPEAARYLLTKTNQEMSSLSSQVIIEMITTIMMYKFEQLTLREVEVMLGISLEKSRAYREIKQERREEGREEATLNLVIRLLTKRFGELPAEMRGSISVLPLPVMENLSEALLDFTSLNDLQVWLAAVKS